VCASARTWQAAVLGYVKILIDLAVVVGGGQLDHLASANMSPVVVRQLQAFHRAVIDDREL